MKKVIDLISKNYLPLEENQTFSLGGFWNSVLDVLLKIKNEAIISSVSKSNL